MGQRNMLQKRFTFNFMGLPKLKDTFNMVQGLQQSHIPKLTYFELLLANFVILSK